MAPASGLLGSAAELLRALAALARDRLALLGAEIEEDAERVIHATRLGFAAVALAALGAAFIATALLLAVPAAARPAVAGAVGVAFLIGALAAARAARRVALQKPRFLDATLEALENDCRSLSRPGP